MLRRVVESSWFSFLDLTCASASCLIWYFQPGAGWWPLLLALLPWALRLSAGLFPFKRTPFDFALLFFLLTAGIGGWVSYNPLAAWDKFWLIVGSILLYYALAGQPVSNLLPIYGLVGILGAAVALTTIFDSNIANYIQDLSIIQRLSLWWQASRPDWQVNGLSPNVSGGLLAVLLPFPLVLVANSFGIRKAVVGITAFILSVLMLLALVLSSSRGAWIALALALTAGLFWHSLRLFSYSLSRAFRVSFTIILLLPLVIALGLLATGSGGLGDVLDKLPGLPSGASRVDLAFDTTHILTDFPFTGGGLRAFPGLYSRYVLVIPVNFYEYSHNLYLDVFVEQGLLGLLSLTVILLGSLFLMSTALIKSEDAKSKGLLHLAVVVGLVAIMFHGLVDDALYGMRGTPLLFLVPGIGLALKEPNATRTEKAKHVSSLNWQKMIWLGVLSIILVAAFGQFVHKPLAASWYANLGSVYQAKAELYGFPSGSFEYLPEEGSLEQAKGYFREALLFDPENITANYRMGIIASEERDFQAAIPYLERAFQGNEVHRGIQKVLGYNYAWTAQPDRAVKMLAGIPEARQELAVYVEWWEMHGRSDLSANTKKTLLLMNE